MPSLIAISPAERGKLLGAFLKRFGTLTWGAITIVVVTGIVSTSQLIGFSSLFSFSTRYANILLAKIALVVVMIINGGYIGFILGPKIASFAPPPSVLEKKVDQPRGPPPELLSLQKRMKTLSWLQVVLALVVLFLMGLLVG
jgi:uncharacterized membrane protein